MQATEWLDEKATELFEKALVPAEQKRWGEMFPEADWTPDQPKCSGGVSDE